MHYKTLFIDQFTPIACFSKLQKKFSHELCFLLESTVVNDSGQFSYIFVGERERVQFENGHTLYTDEQAKKTVIDTEPLLFLQQRFKTVDVAACKELMAKTGLGFVDGFVGYIGYDMIQEFEPVLKRSMAALKEDIHIPDFDMVRPRFTIAYSHKSSQITLLGCEADKDTLESIAALLGGDYVYEPLRKPHGDFRCEKLLSDNEFKQNVVKAKEHIKAGDVFQVLVANRMSVYANIDAYSFYRILRTKNPSPYMYYLSYGGFSIAGSSPEVMIRLRNGEILSRPIAGTRKRGKETSRDAELEAEMLNDPKEKAEHIMLVDLARNDLGRVSKTGSINVGELMRVEKYSHVMHMVSDVTGELDAEKDMFDVFRATFTAGTMTGAPKIKAMEIIASMEGTKRGFYSGSVGYFGFDGNMDFAIAIRTALITDDRIVFQAGAGIVADSVPELELLEITNKLAANVSSFEDLQHVGE